MTAYSERLLLPDSLRGPPVDAPSLLGVAAALRRSFADEGYVFLRDVLPRDEIFTARRMIFSLLAAVGEIKEPVDQGLATGTSRRREMSPDLGAFWKTVSDHPALRTV